MESVSKTGVEDFDNSFPETIAESGSVTSIFMLVSIILILIAEKSWDTFFGELNLISQLLIAASFFSFILYSLLVGIYTVISGEPSYKQLRKMVIKESKKLDLLVQEANKAIQEFESQLRVVSGIMHPQGFKELIKVKAMLSSLEARSRKAKNLIKSKDEDRIVAGYNIFFSNIGDFEDANAALILDDNLPECPYESIPQELKRRIEFVEKTLPVKSSFAI